MPSEWPSDTGSDEDSETTFSETTKRHIRALYRERCAICLNHLPPGEEQFAHFIAPSEEGTKTVKDGHFLGMIRPDYDRSSKDNGFLLCGSCMDLFKLKIVTFSPPWPILKYILKSLNRPNNSQSIYEICQSLVQSFTDPLSAPEDVEPLMPYLGLYSLVTLKSHKVREHLISTTKLPPLSTLNNHEFVPAPSDAHPSNPDVVRIFEASAITSTLPLSMGVIPLTDYFSEYHQRRYWRIPLPVEAVLTVLIMSMTLSAYYAVDTEEYYAVRIWLFSASLKHRVQDVGVGEPDVKPAGIEGGHAGRKEVHGKAKDAHEADRRKKVGSRLREEDIAQWAASATTCPVESPHDDGIDAPLFNDMMDTQSDNQTASSPVPPAQDSDDWEFGPEMSTVQIAFRRRAFLLY